MTITTLDALREAAPRLIDHPQLHGRQLDALEQLLTDTREFARNSIRPQALELDRIADKDPGHFPWELAAEGAKLGLLNLITPRPSGGDADQFCVRASLVAEEIASGCGGMATLFGAHALGLTPLVTGGPAFWDGVMKDVAASKDDDRPMIMACAITEPAAGTDVEHHQYVRTAKLVSRATKVEGGYRISGVKHFISNGNVARWITVIMPTDARRPYETSMGFLVAGDSPGFSVTKVEHKMGQRSSPAAELTFDDVFVPDRNAIGRPGDGTPMIAGVLAGSRPVVGGIATGIARGAYERLLDWLEHDPAAAGLLDRQQVQISLAKMFEAIHVSRQTYLDAATEFDEISLGKLFTKAYVKLFGRMPSAVRTNPVAKKRMNSDNSRRLMMQLMNREVGDRVLTQTLGMSSMAKALGGDTAMWVTGQALEIAGLDCGALRPELEKCFRDAKLCQIYEGTNQLNRLEAFEGLVARHSMQVLDDAAAGMPLAPRHRAKGAML
ncbi:MAG: acyl-CoA/acyl-ACP dehydrogenase [Thermoleophilaceae bacterium]|nr:acyl-CoA/acyl-ACP dehydrogenase [Thermoleophilaceae bacterium]